MKENDKISIIVPCYNVEKCVSKCIDSITNQSYQNIEIILINDGSKDKTLEIIEKYKKEDDRIKIIDKKSTGVSDTRNIGIKVANGKYIMFADADDYFEYNAVELLYKCISSKNLNVVRARYKRLENEKIILEDDIEQYNSKSLEILLKDILNGKIGCYVWALIIKKDFLVSHNIKFDKNLTIMEDQLFYINLLINDKIFFCNEIIYDYVINTTSTTQNINNYIHIYNEMLKAKELIIDILKKNKLWDKDLSNSLTQFITVNEICYFLWNLYKNKKIKKYN